MTPRDLIPHIGSKSRVSEVLAGKRPLTLGMIRSLHKHLGIPSDILLQSPEDLPQEPSGIQWEKYPLKEMVKRGWFQGIREWTREFKAQAEELVRLLHARAGGGTLCLPEVCFRMSPRKNAKTDPYALHAWILGVKAKAMARGLRQKGKFDPDRINDEFLKNVVQLSVLPNGPRVAQDYLEAFGIILVVESHFDRTYLDGAAMLLEDGTPVIGLTLRYDRIDNFWFCLLHELSHVGKHLHGDNTRLLVDDLDITSDEKHEVEADKDARDAEIPPELWVTHPAKTTRAIEDVLNLAAALRIHPAIVAGRVRFESKNYRMLSKLVGVKEVRKLFEEGAKR